jgi:hypothetical protein
MWDTGVQAIGTWCCVGPTSGFICLFVWRYKGINVHTWSIASQNKCSSFCLCFGEGEWWTKRDASLSSLNLKDANPCSWMTCFHMSDLRAFIFVVHCYLVWICCLTLSVLLKTQLSLENKFQSYEVLWICFGLYTIWIASFFGYTSPFSLENDSNHTHLENDCNWVIESILSTKHIANHSL